MQNNYNRPRNRLVPIIVCVNGNAFYGRNMFALFVFSPQNDELPKCEAPINIKLNVSKRKWLPVHATKRHFAESAIAQSIGFSRPYHLPICFRRRPAFSIAAFMRALASNSPPAFSSFFASIFALGISTSPPAWCGSGRCKCKIQYKLSSTVQWSLIWAVIAPSHSEQKIMADPGLSRRSGGTPIYYLSRFS